MITPCFSQRRSLQRARADTQARVTVTWWRPWRQVADGTVCFSQNWMGCMWSRPNWSTGKATAIRPSIFWKTLGGQVVPSSKEGTWCWISNHVACSAETVAVLCTESITVPRNKTHWLRDSMLLAKLTLSPRQPKWLRRRVLCDVETASDWARARSVALFRSLNEAASRPASSLASILAWKTWSTAIECSAEAACLAAEYTRPASADVQLGWMARPCLPSDSRGRAEMRGHGLIQSRQVLVSFLFSAVNWCESSGSRRTDARRVGGCATISWARHELRGRRGTSVGGGAW